MSSELSHGNIPSSTVAPRISDRRHARERWLLGGASAAAVLVAALPAFFHERISTMIQGIQNRLSTHQTGFNTEKHSLPVQEMNGIRIESTLILSHHIDGRIMDMRMECVLSGDEQPVTICQSKINPQIILNGADNVIATKNWTPEIRDTVRRSLGLSESELSPQAQGNVWGRIPGATDEDRWQWALVHGTQVIDMVLEEATADADASKRPSVMVTASTQE